MHEYYFLSKIEKKLICSHNPKDDKDVNKLLIAKKLQHKKRNFRNLNDRVENAIQDYAGWLREYADSFLRGDFSNWFKIYEYKVNTQRAAHIRSGGDEFMKVFDGLEASGKPTYRKESIFQQNLLYVDKLRKEK